MGKKNTLYLSIDIESDGPIPAVNSMLSFGAQLYNESGERLDSFKANLKRLPNANPDPHTMRWWKTQREAYEKTRVSTQDPKNAMKGFYGWLEAWRRDGEDGSTITAVGYPITFDFMWLYWYLMKFVGTCPFSFSGMDIKTMMALRQNVPYKRATKNGSPYVGEKGKHTHDPLEDAREQGDLFFALLKDKRTSQ